MGRLAATGQENLYYYRLQLRIEQYFKPNLQAVLLETCLHVRHCLTRPVERRMMASTSSACPVRRCLSEGLHPVSRGRISPGSREGGGHARVRRGPDEDDGTVSRPAVRCRTHQLIRPFDRSKPPLSCDSGLTTLP